MKKDVYVLFMIMKQDNNYSTHILGVYDSKERVLGHLSRAYNNICVEMNVINSSFSEELMEASLECEFGINVEFHTKETQLNYDRTLN